MWRMFFVATFVLFGVNTESARGQKADDGKEPLRSLPADVRKLSEATWEFQDSTTSQKSELAQLRKSTMKHSKALKDLIGAKQPSPEYRASLKQTQDALKRISMPDCSAEKGLAVWRSVGKDLQVKRVFAEKNPQEPFGPIGVTVWTRKGQAVVNGLQVWYVPAAWADDKARHKTFDKFSSPTKKPLAPGAYVMWTCDPGQGHVGKEQPISVGEDGSTEQSVDLSAPR